LARQKLAGEATSEQSGGAEMRSGGGGGEDGESYIQIAANSENM